MEMIYNNTDNDDTLSLKIKNKTYKAYKTLQKASEYLEKIDKYTFKCGKAIIEGNDHKPICVHVSMYSMDFIASNVHVLLPAVLNERNPILSISIEHLFAILSDCKLNNRDIFMYWRNRIDIIRKYPKKYFDNNELNLYYEVITPNFMLNEFINAGLIDNLKAYGHIISSFHNEYGEETRPAKMMLDVLDSNLLNMIIENGKNWFGINKRYLKSLYSYLIEINSEKLV